MKNMIVGGTVKERATKRERKSEGKASKSVCVCEEECLCKRMREKKKPQNMRIY